MSQKEFNPHNEKYKQVSDLPVDQRESFVDVDENGFVTKDAAKELSDAQLEAEFRKTFRKKSENPLDILHEQAINQDEEYQKAIKKEIYSDYTRLLDAPRHIQSDRKFIFELIERSKGEALQYVLEELRSDREFVLELIKQRANRPNGYGWAEPLLQYLPENIRNDKEIVLKVIATNNDQFQYISEELRTDRKFALEAVRKSSLVVEHLPENFRNDKEIILKAMKSEGTHYSFAFQYASEELHSDREFVLEIAKYTKRNVAYATEALRSDREFMLTILRQQSQEPFRQTLMVHPPATAFRYASKELRSDREFVLETIKTGILEYDVLNHIPESLLNDREIIMEAIKRDSRTNWPSSFQSASKKLRSDREFVLEVVKIDHRAFEYASGDLRADREIVLEVLKKENEANAKSGIYEYISKKLRSDPKFALEAAHINPSIRHYLTGKAGELYDRSSRS